MAGIMCAVTSSMGSMPLSSNRRAVAAERLLSPFRMASKSSERSDMTSSLSSGRPCACAAELVYRFQHGDDVSDRCLRLDVMNGVEDETAAFGKHLAALQNLSANLFRRAEGQHLLRVHASAPEHDAVAITFLQVPRVHA